MTLQSADLPRVRTPLINYDFISGDDVVITGAKGDTLLQGQIISSAPTSEGTRKVVVGISPLSGIGGTVHEIDEKQIVPLMLIDDPNRKTLAASAFIEVVNGSPSAGSGDLIASALESGCLFITPAMAKVLAVMVAGLIPCPLTGAVTAIKP